MSEQEEEALTRVTLTLCSPCVSGEGGECHTPGCSLWLNRAPDVPINVEFENARAGVAFVPYSGVAK